MRGYPESVDPLLFAELWWVVPTAVGAGAIGVVGVRRARRGGSRRIAYEAARAELTQAKAHAATARVDVRVARAELAHVQAERAAAKAASVGTAVDVASAKRALQGAQRRVGAASALVRARRVQLSVARTALSDRRAPEPLAALHTRHDLVTQRWMTYETDPAKLIAFPAMSDARVPATAAFLTARAEVSACRPAVGAPLSTAEFAAYRDAVAALERTFDAAETAAWREARKSGTVPPERSPWAVIAEDVVTRSTAAITRAAGAAAQAAADRIDTRRGRGGSDGGARD